MSEMTTRSVRDVWTAENAQGLALAAASSWPEAAEAFARAVDAVGMQREIASHDALALVLGNLAQACFRAGRIDDGIRHAQRACALRAALVGEDAISSARARADLAVMLGSTGRLDEASALMDRAIACMGQSAGEDDIRLIGPLENAARLALASAHPVNAEPHLLRLHTLLAEHGLPTARADVLLARVASKRVRLAALSSPADTANASEERVAVSAIQAEPTVADPSVTVTLAPAAAVAPVVTVAPAAMVVTEAALATAATARANGVQPTSGRATSVEPTRDSVREIDAEPDDQQLLDALLVAETLLRATPRATPTVTANPNPGRDADAFVEWTSPADAVRLDLVDEFLDHAQTRAATSDAELQDAEIEDAIVEIVAIEAVDDEIDRASLFDAATENSPADLGFSVEHGVQQDDSALPWYEVTGFSPAEIGRVDPTAEAKAEPKVEPKIEPRVPPASQRAEPVAPRETPTPSKGAPPPTFDGRPPEVRFYVTPTEGFVPGDISTPKPKPSVRPGIPVVLPTPHRGTSAQHSVRNFASRENHVVRGSAPKGNQRVRSADDASRTRSKRPRGEASTGSAFWQVWLWGVLCIALGCAAVVLYFQYRPV